MHAQKYQDSTSAATPRPPSYQSRAPARGRDPDRSRPLGRAVRGAQWPMLPSPAGRPRVTGVVLAAAGWTATFAAVMAGRHLGRGAAAQIIFAAAMITFAMAGTLVSPASPVITDDRTPPVAAGRRSRLGAVALIICCMLGLPAVGAALGAGWATSLLTSLAVACALASIIAQRAGRPPKPL